MIHSSRDCTANRAATRAAQRVAIRASFSLAMLLLYPLAVAHAQGTTPASSTSSPAVQPLELVAGRSFPVTGVSAISKVTVVNPAIADVVVISQTEVVFNAIAAGETDIILWSTDQPRRHYRVSVRSSSDRRQVLLSVKFAEVRRDALRQMGASLLLRPGSGGTRVGSGVFRNGDAIGADGSASVPAESNFLTILSTFNSRELLGLLEAEEQTGRARSLAEPNLMAANREDASFLAGGEIPVPIVQGGSANGVTVQYREFGVRLNFNAEVLSDSLIKLKVRPEVSQLDYSNSITLSGFRIPAIRTRRIESTVDVLQNRSLIISGLFNEEREQVRTGLPFLSAIPILGELFSSQRWLKSESELIVVVTPVIMDPNNPRPADLLQIVPDSTVPASQAMQKRLQLPPVKPPR